MLTTVLESFVGQKSPDHLDSSEDVDEQTDGDANGTTDRSETYEVVIIGSGQHGLGFAGRLQALGISYIVVECNAEVGDTWLNRYDSLRLLTPREQNELRLGRTWGPEEPLYLPARNNVDGHRRYVKNYRINVRRSTTVDSCIWDEACRTWTVEATSAGSQIIIKGKQVALATGGGYGQVRWPEWPGKEPFKGLLMHCTMYKNTKGWERKAAVIIGTGTSAHDIARDMFGTGMSVTVAQRGRTAVFPKEWTESLVVGQW